VRRQEAALEGHRAALFGETEGELRQDVTFNVIRSRNHQLASLSLTKTGLCAVDDNIHTLDAGARPLACASGHGGGRQLRTTRHA
jgi:hypothetical protein